MTNLARTDSAHIDPLTFFPEARETALDYDMVDDPEGELIARFPVLERGLAVLKTRLAPMYFRSDTAALQLQRGHRALATVAVTIGGAVVVFAILQLTFSAADRLVGDSASLPRLVLSWSSSLAREGELVGLILCAIAVGVGLWVSAQIGWLRERHKAELCRLLKFRSLADPLLWQDAMAEWEHELKANVAKIEQLDSLRTSQNLHERVIHDPVRGVPTRIDAFRMAPEGLVGLAAYYLSKRIRCQRKYFENRSTRYERSAIWVHRIPLGCFFGSIAAAFLHFGIDYASAWRHPDSPEPVTMELAAMTALALAAILPVVGASVRAYRSVHEFARSAALFHAKANAMKEFERRVSKPSATDADAPRLLRAILECENFLEAEHREWLRLMLESEWFG